MSAERTECAIPTPVVAAAANALPESTAELTMGGSLAAAGARRCSTGAPRSEIGRGLEAGVLMPIATAGPTLALECGAASVDIAISVDEGTG